MQNDTSNFRCRCSAIGKIMTNAREKTKPSYPLGDTCIKYLREWYIEKKYGIKSEIKSKYLDKGKECEDLSITLIGIVDETTYEKNELYFENDWITGTPDIITDTEVIDVKTSWSIATFPFGENDYDKAYKYQLNGYMDLTGHSNSRLAYCLINTPEHLIADEIRRFAWDNNLIDVPAELVQEIRANFIYDAIEIENRIKIFDIPKDEKIIADIYERVELCKNYINKTFKF